MADEKYEVELDIIQTRAQKALRKTIAATKTLGEGLKGIKAGVDRFNDALGGMSEAMDSAAPGFGDLIDKLKEAVLAFGDAEQAQKRLANEIARGGGTAEEQAATLERLGKVARANAKEFGTSAEEQVEAQRLLFKSTGDAAQVERDLALAIDISAATGESLLSSVNAITDARIGGTRALEEHNILSLRQIETLNDMQNEHKRGAIVLAHLEDRFHGAADGAKGVNTEVANYTENVKSLTVSLGDLVVGVGVDFLEWLGNGAARLTESATGMERGQLSLNNFTDAFQKFVDAIKEAWEEVKIFAAHIDGLEDTMTLSRDILLELTGQTENYETVSNKVRTALGLEERQVRTLAERYNEGADAIAKQREEAEKLAAETEKRKLGEDPRAPRPEPPPPPKVKEKSRGVSDAEFLEGLGGKVDVHGIVDALHEEDEARKALLETAQTELDLLLTKDEMQQIAIERAQALRELERENLDEATRAIRERIILEQATAKILDVRHRKAVAQNAEDLRIKEEGERLDEETKEKAKEAQEAAVEAARTGVDASIDLAEQVGVDERAIALLKGGIQVAESIAAFASGNIPGGAGHAAAAAQFFAAAGGVGAGSGGGGGGGGGGGRVPRPKPVDPDKIARDNAKAFADELEGRQRLAAGSSIVVNFSSIASPPPREMRRITDGIARELGNRF